MLVSSGRDSAAMGAIRAYLPAEEEEDEGSDNQDADEDPATPAGPGAAIAVTVAVVPAAGAVRVRGVALVEDGGLVHVKGKNGHCV